jgi:hypothetical protein
VKVTAMNALVQALVWTLLAALLYVAWLHSRAASSGQGGFGLSYHLWQVLGPLQSIWLALTVGLVVAIVVLVWPTVTASARQSDTACPPALISNAPLGWDSQSILSVCGRIESVPEEVYGNWRINGVQFTVSPGTHFESMPDSIAQGQYARADIVRDGELHWGAITVEFAK